MRSLSALAGATLLVAVAMFDVSVSEAAPPEVAQMFAARCATCHTVPDVAIRTDLAWLDQVKRTS